MGTRLAIIIMTLFASLSSSFASLNAVPVGYKQVAAQYNIPAEILYAIALTESGTKLKQGIRPWPWTINVAGKGYRYPTQKDACIALTGFMRSTRLKRIDVGLGQTNLGYNGHHYQSSCEGFSPYKNLHVTAKILNECYQSQGRGSWLNAAACYHRPTGGRPAQTYRLAVQHHLKTVTQ
ncbi:transglycosylase SLT domain-containing protein [Yersinia massiliensis]|uniref:transglycosylase SLT domain-containing protein n=1 Tax=Yersinia massiliensis TaxID=419257 RepID=UPI00384DD904